MILPLSHHRVMLAHDLTCIFRSAAKAASILSVGRRCRAAQISGRSGSFALPNCEISGLGRCLITGCYGLPFEGQADDAAPDGAERSFWFGCYNDAAPDGAGISAFA